MATPTLGSLRFGSPARASVCRRRGVGHEVSSHTAVLGEIDKHATCHGPIDKMVSILVFMRDYSEKAKEVSSLYFLMVVSSALGPCLASAFYAYFHRRTSH